MMQLQYYLIILSSVIGLAAAFVLTKVYQNLTNTALRVSVLYNIMAGLCTALVFFCFNGFRLSITPFSIGMALIMTLCSGTYVILGFKLISMGHISTYTLFLMLGGMMLPYFFGLGFLNEEFSLLRLFGLILMIVSIILTGMHDENSQAHLQHADENPPSKKRHKKYLLICLTVFLLNGVVNIIAKVHQLPEFSDLAVTAKEFVMLTALTKAVVFSLLYYYLCFRDYKKPIDQKPPRAKFTLLVFGVITAGALVDGLSCLGQLTSASHLPATVLFPLVTGGSIILTALAGRIFFREKPSKKALVGIILCFVATLFFL